MYFEHLRCNFLTAVKETLEGLQKYVVSKLNGSSKGARLGFSTEKEMFNICIKLLVSFNVEQRHILSFFW